MRVRKRTAVGCPGDGNGTVMRARRLLATAGLLGTLIATVGTLSIGPAHAASDTSLTGVVHVLAADTVGDSSTKAHGRGATWKGKSSDVYRQVLVVGKRAYTIKGKHLKNNSKVRLTGQVSGNTVTVSTATVVSTTAGFPDTGTTRVLAMLADWTVPDSMTPATAAQQLFSDTNGWYRGVSGGLVGQVGDVTPWLTIAPPSAGSCYNDSYTLMEEAKGAASTLGYDLTSYDNFVLYFPYCSGDAAGYAGWAFVDAADTWLNGYMDRRVTVHEQGHNYGLWHSHSYSCTGGGLAGTCDFEEYGNLYDAMGGSGYVGSFSAAQQDILGWLGAGKVANLSAGGTVNLAPLSDTSSALPRALYVTIAGVAHKYWLEYRQPTGYDSWLPTDGTDGALMDITDDPAANYDSAPSLLDVRPSDGADPSTSTLRAGSSWKSSEGITFTVSALTSSSATVAVTLPGQAVAPSNPTLVSGVKASTSSATITWSPPTSSGGATVTGYQVGRDGTDLYGTGPWSTVVPATARSRTIKNLVTGRTYYLSVQAINSAGTGPLIVIGVPIMSTTVLNAPSKVSVTKTGSTATISWQPPTVLAGKTITGYRVSRNGVDVNGVLNPTTNVSSSARSYTFAKLVGGSTYSLTVRAVTSTGGLGPTSKGSVKVG